jgi:hypothetical protein
MRINLDDAIHVSTEVEDDSLTNRLPGQAAAASTGNDWDLVRLGVLNYAHDILRCPWQDYGQRDDFIRARIGRVHGALDIGAEHITLDERT